MTPRFFKRVAMTSWALVLLGLGGAAVLPSPPDGLAPAGIAFLMAFVSLPVALWSPVGLGCAFVVASGRGWTRLAGIGIALTYAAALMTVVPFASTGVYYPGGRLGQILLRMTVPVYVTALAVAYAALVSTARVGSGLDRVRRLSVTGMSIVPIIVTAMVVVDSGNRALFAGLGALILLALASGLVLWGADRRRNVVTGP